MYSIRYQSISFKTKKLCGVLGFFLALFLHLENVLMIKSHVVSFPNRIRRSLNRYKMPQTKLILVHTIHQLISTTYSYTLLFVHFLQFPQCHLSYVGEKSLIICHCVWVINITAQGNICFPLRCQSRFPPTVHTVL